MSTPCVNACTPWAGRSDLKGDCASLDGDLLDDMLAVATDLLFELSARQFPGFCADTVRPTSTRTGSWIPWRYQVAWGSLIDGARWDGRCDCSGERVGCYRVSQIHLGVEPLDLVTRVTLDGVELEADVDYRVDDHRWLVRLPDADGTPRGWPCCQRVDFPATEPGTFEVSFTYGRMPPAAGKRAACALACELAKAATPGQECSLPKRLTSVTRAGLSFAVLDAFDFLDAGKTGVYEVDLFLGTYNPGGNARPPGVLSPDVPSPARRVGT